MSNVREAHVMTDENGNQIAVEPFDIKGFAKKHLWKVALGEGVITFGVIAKDKLDSNHPIKKFFEKKATANLDSGLITGLLDNKPVTNYKELYIPDDFFTAHIDELWQEGDDVLATMHDIDIHDLGKFGEELREKIPELKDKDFVHFPCVGFTRFNAD